MKSRHTRGYTLVEILAVVVILGIIARVAIPMFSSTLDQNRLAVAAEEVGNALRFAIAESNRTGGYILVDALTVPGHLLIVRSDLSGNNLGAVIDPHTKRALDIDTAGGAFSSQVTMTPRFMKSSTAQPKMLIAPGPLLQTYSGGGGSYGPMDAGSSVVLALGSLSVTVAINETTAFVAIP